MILLALLWLTTLLSLWHAIHLTRAINRRALLTDDIAGCCESLGFVGFSVLCSRVRTLEQIESLLAQSYDRYEVVVVLDSKSDGEAFHRIIDHYRMIRVNSASTDELPTAMARALYRSRQRSFRRLILIDRAEGTVYDDLDAALSVASYAYVIPTTEGERLCAKAIEGLAITLSQATSQPEVLHSTTSDKHIFHREYVIRHGGFSPHILRFAAPSQRLQTALPITYRQPLTKGQKMSLAGTIFLLLGAFLIIEWQTLGPMPAMATAAMALSLWMTLRYEAHAVEGAKCSGKVAICHFLRLAEIFRIRKFII